MKKLVYVGMVLASAVSAGTVVHTVTVNPTLTDWSVTNRVPQFDARLGTLRSVQVLAVTNAVSARVGTLTANNSITVSGSASVTFGVTNVDTFAVVLGRAVSTNRNLGVFVGTNTLPVVTQATARTWYSGPGDFSLRWDTRASAVAPTKWWRIIFVASRK